MLPEYPLEVLFSEGGESLFLENKFDVCTALEWFDSEDPDERAVVTDKFGRSVKLKVEFLEMLICELKL